jgi:hypothetical protein
MGRTSKSGRRPSARSSGRKRRRAGSRARARVRGARGDAGPVHWLEMTGAMGATTIAALELEVRHVARRYHAEIKDFRVKVRRRSG